jgi:hypothetical protein
VNSSQGGGSKDTWVLEDEPTVPASPEFTGESNPRPDQFRTAEGGRPAL